MLLYQEQREFVYYEDGITYDTRTEEENVQVDNDTRAAVPNSNIFGSAASLKLLTGTMGSGYPAASEGASQMDGSLKTAVEARVHDEPNFKGDFEVCQAGQSNQQPRTMSMVQDSWADTPARQAPDLRSDFCVTDSGSQDEIHSGC